MPTQLEHFIQTELGGDAKAVLAGNSLGGLVAANLAATRPELVEGLVFLNATPFWGFNKPWLPIWKGQLPVPKSIQVSYTQTALGLWGALSRRTCSPRYGLHSCPRDCAGVAKRRA